MLTQCITERTVQLSYDQLQQRCVSLCPFVYNTQVLCHTHIFTPSMSLIYHKTLPVCVCVCIQQAEPAKHLIPQRYLKSTVFRHPSNSFMHLGEMGMKMCFIYMERLPGFRSAVWKVRRHQQQWAFIHSFIHSWKPSFPPMLRMGINCLIFTKDSGDEKTRIKAENDSTLFAFPRPVVESTGPPCLWSSSKIIITMTTLGVGRTEQTVII